MVRGTLAADTVIVGILWKSGIAFYDNGKIERGHLSVDTEIDGVKYKAEGKYYDDIGLYENGRVKFGTLATDFTIDGVKLKTETWIELLENGGIKFASLNGRNVVNNKVESNPSPVSRSDSDESRRPWDETPCDRGNIDCQRNKENAREQRLRREENARKAAEERRSREENADREFHKYDHPHHSIW